MKSTASNHKARGSIAPADLLENAPAPEGVERLEQISMAAYFKAEARGFSPGGELDDWLRAEEELQERKLR